MKQMVRICTAAPFRLTVAVVVLVLLAGSCSDEDLATLGKTPSIESIAPERAGIGDTITVTGTDFEDLPSMNRIAFSPTGFSTSGDSRYATPFAVEMGEVRGVVPDGAFTGAVRVESLNPTRSTYPLGYGLPPVPSNELPFGVSQQPGDVGKIFFAGTSYDFTIETGAAGEEYLLVLFNSLPPPPLQSPDYRYSVYGTTGTGSRAAESIVVNGPGPDAGSPRDLLIAAYHDRYRSFKRRIREEVRDLLDGRTSAPAPLEVHPRAGIIRPQSPAQTISLYVISDADGSISDPGSYTSVTADLKFTGLHTLLYVDQSTHESCITDQEAIDLGRNFDESIYQTDRTYFGSESDINGDGKIAILLTPVVNEMTEPGAASTTGFISGFFNPVDLLPGYVPTGTSNGMEIFYTIVPDPTNQYGNTYEKGPALEVIRGTLAHEFQHMINFNYRVIIYGHGSQPQYMEELWLDEGLSHIAEDLNGHYDSNIKRANLFLEDPGDVPFIYGGDALAERGASYLLLRYLGDRYGDTIFKDIVQSKKTGTANIAQAAGEEFIELFADWSAALYLTELGVTSDPRFNYVSIDLRGDFDPLLVTGVHFASSQTVSGDVKSMAPEFIDMTVPPNTALELSIVCTTAGGWMNAVVVRIQ